MTKNWAAVRGYIEDYSFKQKMPLEQVMALMQRKHSFRASKRAYRLKIKEWGLMRHKQHRPRQVNLPARRRDTSHRSMSDSTLVGDSSSGNEKHVDSITFTAFRPDEERLKYIILNAICDGNEFEVESHFRTVEGRACLNRPLGNDLESRDAHSLSAWDLTPKPLSILPDGCVLLQHDCQTFLDVASALPNPAVVQKLLQAGARSSVHSQGTQVSMSNAIRNGHVENVRALLESGACVASGLHQCTWVPLRQAAFWLFPSIIQLLLDHGAHANPFLDVGPSKTPIQLAVDRRASEYHNEDIRIEAERTIKMLLDAGADVLTDKRHDLDGWTPFESFLEPWKSDATWSSHLSPVETSILQSFIANGAALQTRFIPTSCTSPSSETFSHQLLYHAPSHFTRLVIDHANVRPGGNGCHILHELVGSCPDAKRHPAETLRDIEVLLKRGADPNGLDGNGRTALTACLGLCPSIDVFDRIQLLLRGGADPEERDAKGFDPVLMAIKGFQDPLRFRLTETLLYSYPTTTGPSRGEHSWLESHFNFSEEQAINFHALMQKYGLVRGFPVVNMPLHLSPPTRDSINRATFSVATTRILDAAVRQQNRGGVLRSDDILRVIRMREDAGLPRYEFDQAFVLELLSATIPSPLAPPVGIYTQALDAIPIGVTAAGHSWDFGQMAIQ